MQPYLIVLLVILSVLIFVILLLFSLAALCFHFGFGTRCDKNPLLKYFEGKDFSLREKEVEISNGRVTLRGKLYGEPSATLVLFCHGLGAGHLAYTTEIATFCRHGAQVLAVDYEGCNLSEGKSIRGMYSGAECVLSVIRFVRKSPDLAEKKLWLVGHSWGGYSALCAAQREQVDGVIAVSAPDSPIEVLFYNAARILGRPIGLLLIPFWRLFNYIKFGKYGNSCASDPVVGRVPVLLVHGDHDNVVPLEYSAFEKAAGENVQKYLCAGKSHNPYNSADAQRLLIELSERLFRAKKMTEEERVKYFGNFDFSAATEEDEEVMRKVTGFMGL